MKNADFHDRLIEAMKIRSVSAADLCRLTGIDKSSLSRYRSGAYKPNQLNTYLLAQALRVNPAWLMGFDVPMSSDDDLQQLLENPSPAQLAWLEYQKAQALVDVFINRVYYYPDHLLILFNFGGDGSRVQIDFGSSNNDDQSQPFVNYSNPTLLWAGSICLYVPL